MMIKLAATLGLLLATVLSVSCQDAEQESTTLAIEEPLQVVEFKINKTHVSVPLYENVAPSTERRLEFDQQVVDQVMELVDRLVYDMAIRRKNAVVVSTLAIPKIIKTLFQMLGKLKALKGPDALPEIKKEYTKKMAGLMRSIIQSKYKGPKILSDKEAYDKTKLLMDAVKAVPANSPSGIYVDWRQLEIDGVRIDEYSYPIIEWFNQSGGRKFVLGRADQIIGIFENLGL